MNDSGNRFDTVDARARPPRSRSAIGALAALVATFALAPSGTVVAQGTEDAAAACLEAARLIDEDDVDGALDEARWCVESLEQVRQQRTLTVFPDEVEGFAGGELDNQSAMGMTMMERVYRRGDDEVSVQLATGAAGTGLAAIAQMGMSLGSGSGKKLRVQKRTVVDMSEGEGEASYLVQLKSGGMLTIGSSTLGRDALLEFVRAFPIVELDETLER